ncbi:MAG: penicillin-binding protein activator [Deltaproteobacteria bacterium]|nr:penicillin-binding protein activator [Deltaproteobacteria bacterium]
MKLKSLVNIHFFVLFSLLSLIIWGCAKPSVPPVILTPTQPPGAELLSGEAVFSQAEELFLKKSFDEAMEKYRAYLEWYPEGPLADAALYKIGSIQTYREDLDGALATYQTLVESYPESPLTREAMIEVLDIYNRQGRYTDAIDFAFKIAENDLSESQLLRKYVLLGDAHMGVGTPEDAFYFYSAAYRLAGDFEKERLLEKVKAAVAGLREVHLVNLLARVKTPLLRGHLLYRFGLICIEKGKTDDALEALTQLTKTMPEHEMAQPAQELIDEIISKSISSPYTVGCLLPLSGRYRTYGQRALQGIELAYQRHVQAGGRPGIRLVVKDTQADPFKTTAAVRELDAENAAVILGPMIMSEPAALEAQARGIPILTFTQREGITATGNFVFRNFITPKMQARTLADYATETLNVKRFAILYPREHYGTTYMNLFWDEIDARGGTISAIDSYDPELNDFAVPIKKMVGLYFPVPDDLKIDFEMLPEEDTPWWLDHFNPRTVVPFFPRELKSIAVLYKTVPDTVLGPVATDEERSRNEEAEPVVDFQAVFIPDAPGKAGLIIPQLAYHDVNDVYLLGTNLWHSTELLEMARRYVQGAVMTEGFSPNSGLVQVKRFVQAFEDAFGKSPGFIEAVTYDSADMVFQILGTPGIRFKNHVKDELLNLVNFPGVTGRTHFDYSGDAVKALFLLEVTGDSFVEARQP